MTKARYVVENLNATIGVLDELIGKECKGTPFEKLQEMTRKVRKQERTIANLREEVAILRKNYYDVVHKLCSRYSQIRDLSTRISEKKVGADECSEDNNTLKEERKIVEGGFREMVASRLHKWGAIIQANFHVVKNGDSLPYITFGYSSSFEAADILSKWVMADPSHRLPSSIEHTSGYSLQTIRDGNDIYRLAYGNNVTPNMFLEENEYKEIVQKFCSWYYGGIQK